MKKVLVFLCIFFVFCVCAGALFCDVLPDVASASDVVQTHKDTLKCDGFSLKTILKNNSPCGVRFFGYFFGKSDISVKVEIYSDSEWNLNFYIGDENYIESEARDDSKTYLTKEQTETKERVIRLFEEVYSLINRVDSCANTRYDGVEAEESDIFRYNSAIFGEKIEISRETFEMLSVAREMYNVTDGAFNPAVYRLVDLWGFSSRIYSYGDFGLPYDREVSGEYFAQYGYPLPDQKYIDAFSASEFVDFSEDAVVLTTENDKYFVTKNVAPTVVDGVEYQQWLDLGGIAKGWAVDEIQSLLGSFGIENFFVDAGGSSLAFGENDGGSFLAVADPLAPYSQIVQTELLSLQVGQCSVSTSGQYIRKYTVDGVEYSHIIDGTTGEPAQTGVKLATVIVPKNNGEWAAKADCLTTALTVMGRQKAVEFVNGYLKEHGITVILVYQTVGGDKQLLCNCDEDDVQKGEYFDTYSWVLKKNSEGVFQYIDTVNFEKNNTDAHKTLLIVLCCVLAAATIAAIVVHFAKSKKSALQNVQYARAEKPFKIADIGIYMAVMLLIVVLFSVFFGGEETGWTTLSAEDMESGETLFVLDFARKEYIFNEQNSNGWTAKVTEQTDGLSVTLSREINGEEHFNTFAVSYAEHSVKMTASLCGFHQDCVYNFDALTFGGGAIVCSPNRLKLITE